MTLTHRWSDLRGVEIRHSRPVDHHVTLCGLAVEHTRDYVKGNQRADVRCAACADRMPTPTPTPERTTPVNTPTFGPAPDTGTNPFATVYVSHDGAYRIVTDITDRSVTIHDHTGTFADNPVLRRTFDTVDSTIAAADEVATLQPEGTDWLAWADVYLTDIAEGAES